MRRRDLPFIPIFWALATRDPFMVILAFVVGMSVGHGIMYGVQLVSLANVPFDLRYTGLLSDIRSLPPLGGRLVPLTAAAVVELIMAQLGRSRF